MAKSAKRIVETYVVASARLGNKAAQTELVARYQKKLLGHAYRLLGDTEQAKDAVQDGWVEIVHGLATLNDDGAFAAWAYRIVTRRCARIIAERQKTHRLAADIANEPSGICTAGATPDLAADREPLRAALATLSPEHRAAVALFYLEEMSVAEVAVAMDVPVGTVKSRLSNARAKLRAVLDTGDS